MRRDATLALTRRQEDTGVSKRRRTARKIAKNRAISLASALLSYLAVPYLSDEASSVAT